MVRWHVSSMTSQTGPIQTVQHHHIHSVIVALFPGPISGFSRKKFGMGPGNKASVEMACIMGVCNSSL